MIALFSTHLVPVVTYNYSVTSNMRLPHVRGLIPHAQGPLGQLRETIRIKHHAYSTEKASVHWAKQSHEKRGLTPRSAVQDCRTVMRPLRPVWFVQRLRLSHTGYFDGVGRLFALTIVFAWR